MDKDTEHLEPTLDKILENTNIDTPMKILVRENAHIGEHMSLNRLSLSILVSNQAIHTEEWRFKI